MIDIPINVYDSRGRLRKRKSEIGPADTNHIRSSVAIDLQIVGLHADHRFAKDEGDLRQIGNGAATGWRDT